MFINTNSLLVVVDMQRDFVTGVLGTDEAMSIVGRVADKVAGYQKLLFTFDTHDDNYLNTQEGRNLQIRHCIDGTEGHKLVPELDAHSVRGYSVRKKSFGSVQLGLFVAKLFDEGAIDNVVLVGVCTDICVISNAMIIKAFCPEVPIIVDAACCAGTTPENHITALKAMVACQIYIENMGESEKKEKRLVDTEKVYELGHRTPFHIGIADLCDLNELLADVPTVDAVEVVRCKDCKHKDGMPGQPNIVCWQMHDDDFCSYGERKDGDGNGLFQP